MVDLRIGAADQRLSVRKKVWLLVPGLVLAALVAGYRTMPSSDDSVRQMLVQQSVARYVATGGICPCPYSLNRAGLRCTRHSEYDRTGGATALCYPDDATDAMVQSWRAGHR